MGRHSATGRGARGANEGRAALLPPSISPVPSSSPLPFQVREGHTKVAVYLKQEGGELGLSEAEAFEAWCVGRTGAPLVDAAMAQLWVTGWMPRRMRLLCASCLVEGLGPDWRLG